MHTERSHSNSHQQLNTTRWRTRTQKWPRPLKTHGICICRVHMRNVTAQSSGCDTFDAMRLCVHTFLSRTQCLTRETQSHSQYVKGVGLLCPYAKHAVRVSLTHRCKRGIQHSCFACCLFRYRYILYSIQSSM
jgi:hypothetical protein